MVGYKGSALCNGTDDFFSCVYFVRRTISTFTERSHFMATSFSLSLAVTTLQWVVWRSTKVLYLHVNLQVGTDI